MPNLGRKEAILIAAALVAFVLIKKKFSEPGFVADAVAGAVGVVGDAAGGVVVGVGDVLGIPRTNETECERAIREGRTWDASFACPAGTFIKHLWN